MSADATDLLTFAVFGVVGVRLFNGLRYSRRPEARRLIVDVARGIRWRHIWPIPFVLGAIILVATGLLQVPGLDWGWWSALGGSGNPVFGSSTSTTGTVWEWLIPAVFLCLLIPALPLFAHAEERMFRSGAEAWSRGRRALRVVQFGLIHALIGIPIGAALALSIGGAYFMAVYLRAFGQTHGGDQATLESTRAHTAYNGVIIVVVILVIALQASR